METSQAAALLVYRLKHGLSVHPTRARWLAQLHPDAVQAILDYYYMGSVTIHGYLSLSLSLSLCVCVCACDLGVYVCIVEYICRYISYSTDIAKMLAVLIRYYTFSKVLCDWPWLCECARALSFENGCQA